ARLAGGGLRLLGRLERAQALGLGEVARALEELGGLAGLPRDLVAARRHLPLLELLEERGSVLRPAVLVVDPQGVGGVAGAREPGGLLERAAAGLLQLAQLLPRDRLRLLDLPGAAQVAVALQRDHRELRCPFVATEARVEARGALLVAGVELLLHLGLDQALRLRLLARPIPGADRLVRAARLLVGAGGVGPLFGAL